MSKNASKKAVAKSNRKPANETPAAVVVETPAAPVAVVDAPKVSTKLTGEHLVGETLNGKIDVVVKRRQLKTESKVGLIKRLLMTEGQTKETITRAAMALHSGSEKALVNTINTVRADLKRALGGLVVAKGWKTDAKEGKMATAAVAKLRTHEVGTSAFSEGTVPVELKPKAVKPKATTEETPAATETLPEPPAETEVPSEA